MTVHRFPVDPEPEDEEAGPLQFALEGHRQSDKEPWEEVFTVLPALPPQSLGNLAVAAMLNDDKTIDWDAVAVARFLRQVIVPADEPRWDVLIFDKDRLVDPAKLKAAMLMITEERSQRPTGPRPSSLVGSRNGSTGSEEDSSSLDEAPISE